MKPTQSRTLGIRFEPQTVDNFSKTILFNSNVGTTSRTVIGEAAVLEYYVSKSGSDTAGDGSLVNPWSSIQHAIQTINGSDIIPLVINVGVGIYNENIIMNDWESISGGWNNDFSMRWDFDQYGLSPTSSFETIIEANDSGRCVTITDADNVSIDGFTIQNGNLLKGAGIYISSNNVTVQNCIIRHNVNASEGGGIDDDASSTI